MMKTPTDATHSGYRSPLESRNASREMRAIWSEQRKFSTWRRIWLALAESQHELGMPVTRSQVEAIRAHLDPVEFDQAGRVPGCGRRQPDSCIIVAEGRFHLRHLRPQAFRLGSASLTAWLPEVQSPT